MERKIQRANWILRAGAASAKTTEGRRRIEKIELHKGYAEPGYEGDLIATGNWNKVTAWDEENQQFIDLDDTPVRVGNLLESNDVEIEWGDEWGTCNECNRLVRTQPDHYGWTPSYVSHGEERICDDCLDPEEYLKSIEGNHTQVNCAAIDPTDHGYRKVKEFERGMHPGQDADPRIIASFLEKAELKRWLFNLESKGQFDVRFGLYIHDTELAEGIVDPGYPSRGPKFDDEALEWLEEWLNRSRTHGPSISDAMKRGLQEAARQTDQLKGEGVRYASVGMDENGEPTVKAKLVSPKDFVEGKLRDD